MCSLRSDNVSWCGKFGKRHHQQSVVFPLCPRRILLYNIINISTIRGLWPRISHWAVIYKLTKSSLLA